MWPRRPPSCSGLSGWFITAAALAGGAAAAAQTFNYLLPSAVIRLLAILRTGGRYGERVLGHEAALRALARLRPAVFAALAAGRAERSLALASGEASARFVQDVDAIETLFVRQSNPWALAAALVAGLALAALAGWAPVAAIVLAMAVAVLGGRLLSDRFARPPAARAQIAVGELKDSFARFAQAAPELRCYGLEDWAGAQIADNGRALARVRLQAIAAQGWAGLFQGAVVGLTVAGVVLAAGRAPVPLAALAALAALATLDSLAGLVRAMEQDGAVAQAARRLEPILQDAHRSAGLPSRPGDATLELKGFRAPAGTRLALGGPSGVGKTTLLDQLVGLRPVAPDRLRIGGVDVADLDPGAARASFAYAPQTVQLVAGTVRENLRLGAPDALDADLWSALHDAGLDETIRAAGGGLDRWIGDDGVRLSGGERRRLALARALLRRAPWLLLDEPTEGLDARTEALVLQRLRARLAQTGQGLVLVSHRPAALGLADHLLPIGEPATPAATVILAE